MDRKVDINVPPELFDELRKSCSFNKLSMREQVIVILKQYYNSRNKD